MFRACLVALSFASAVAAGNAQTPAPAQPPPVGQPVQIDRNGVLILIRSTLLAVDHANRTGNYTVLRDLGAPGFQTGNTAARLGEIFANLRAQNLDLSGVAVLEPQLTVLPTSAPGGMMRMAGLFPSVPLQVNFEMIFAPVDGRWRLFGIGLNLGQAGPTAPPAPEPPPHAKPETKPAGPDRPGTGPGSNLPPRR